MLATDRFTARCGLRAPDAPAAEIGVLVMSGDPHLRAAATFGFPADVHVTAVEDAEQAWAFMGGAVPSVLIADIRNANEGGFSLAKEMAITERLKRVPILMLLQREQDAWLARQAGASFRRKPVDPMELVATALELASRSL